MDKLAWARCNHIPQHDDIALSPIIFRTHARELFALIVFRTHARELLALMMNAQQPVNYV